MYLNMLHSRLQRLSDSHFGHDHVDHVGDLAYSRNGLCHGNVVVRQEPLVLGAFEGAPDASDAGLGRREEEEPS